MKKMLKRLCTGFLALATVVTALPTTPVHAESKQYWTESAERVGIIEKVMNDGSIGSTFNEGYMKVEGETAYCIDINTDFKNGYKTRADASSRMSADQISDVALSDKDCTKQLATLTTDENGNTDVVEVKAGTVYIKELSAPAGYKVDKTVYSLKVEAGKTATLKVSDIPKVTDTLIELFKIDMETQKGNPQGNASLAGAEFTWKYYAGFYNKDNLPAEASSRWSCIQCVRRKRCIVTVIQ